MQGLQGILSHPDWKEFDALVRGYDGDFQQMEFVHDEDFTLNRVIGCDKCGYTGYTGRTAIHKLLMGTDGHQENDSESRENEGT